MNRTIKFRGKRSDNGEFVFGSYCYEDYGKRDARLGILHAIIDEGGEEFIVDADTIAQFVGYDKDGNEVYEGDIVWNPGIMSYQSAQLINNYEDEHITLKEAKT